MVALDKKKSGKKDKIAKSPKSSVPMKAKNKSPMKQQKNGKGPQKSPMKQQKNGKGPQPSPKNMAAKLKKKSKNQEKKPKTQDKPKTVVESKPKAVVESKPKTVVESKPKTDVKQKPKTQEAKPNKDQQKNGSKKRKRTQSEQTASEAEPSQKKKREFDPETQGFFTNLERAITNEALEKHFAQFGTITDFHPLRRKGYGFVAFAKKSSLENALKVQKHEVSGVEIIFRKAKDGSKSDNSTANKLVVKNLTRAVSREDLLKHFSKFGEVSAAFIPCRGKMQLPYGFVQFSDAKGLKGALKKTTQTVNGVEILCIKATNEKKPKKEESAEAQPKAEKKSKKEKKQKVVEEPEQEEEEEEESDDDEEEELEEEEEVASDDDEEMEDDSDDDDDE